MSDNSSGRVCGLCQRRVRSTSEHHLIPRTCHSNKWFKKRFTRKQMQTTIPLCRDCHRAIHDLIPSEKDLGRRYYTVELLSNHPKMAKFLQWVRKQK